MRRFAGSPEVFGSDGPYPPGARWTITRAERRLDTDTAVIAVRGDFDHGSHGLASDVLRRLEAPWIGTVVIDLRQLTFMDTAGLHLAIEAQMRADDGGWALIVLAPPPPADRVFRLVAPERIDIVYAPPPPGQV
jgi:anti-sigma B factor antagonist